MDEHLQTRDVNDWLEEHNKWWDSLSLEEQEAERAKNKAINEEWEQKNAGKSIDQIFGEGIAEELGKPDWTYKDLPRMVPELFYTFIEIVGEENLHWITMANYGDTLRGQVLISPVGMEKLKKFNA
jgi:hypothetical protein